MRWNNYDLNISTYSGTVTVTAYPMTWTGNIDVHGFPIYLTNSYKGSPHSLNLYMSRPEHAEAIRYALDSEYWDNPEHLFTDRQILEGLANGAHDAMKLVVDYWNESDEWQDASTWTSPPEPILAWLKSLPSYYVALDPDLEASLIQDGMLNDDATTDLWALA
jgi:hypothetical protein